MVVLVGGGNGGWREGERTVAAEDEGEQDPGSRAGNLVGVQGGGEGEERDEGGGGGGGGRVAEVFKHTGRGLDTAHSGDLWGFGDRCDEKCEERR